MSEAPDHQRRHSHGLKPAVKAAAIAASEALGAFRIGHRLARRRHGAAYIRALNYHATPIEVARGLSEQLEFYRDHFVDAGPRELAACLAGKWRTEKPGILLSFDNGYRTHHDFAAPVLERYGFTGWFFVPAGYLTDGSGPRRKDALGREFMTWAELKDLARRGHAIGCHTQNHKRLGDGTPPDELQREIVTAKANLEAGLDAEVESFCWVGGEEWSYGAEAQRTIAAAGYRWSFMTNCAPITRTTDRLWLERTNVEAGWPLPQVRFYLSGIMDRAYQGKRRRIAKRLGGTE